MGRIGNNAVADPLLSAQLLVPQAAANLPITVIHSKGPTKDDWDDIQDALDMGGRIVYLPDDQYFVLQQLRISQNQTWLVGKGKGIDSLQGFLAGYSTSIWFTGAANPLDAVVRVQPKFAPPYAKPPIFGGGVAGLNLLGNGQASYGLLLTACTQFVAADVQCQGSTISQIALLNGTDGSINDWPSAYRLYRCAFNAHAATAGATFAGGTHSGTCYDLSGGTTDGPGLLITGGDDQNFHNTYIGVAGAGQCMDISGVYNATFTGGWPMYGLGTSPVGGRGIIRASAKAVTFKGWSTIDRGPRTTANLTVEPGAVVHWEDDLGRTTNTRDHGTCAEIEDDFTAFSFAASGWAMVGTGTGVEADASAFTTLFGIRRLNTGSTSGSVASITRNLTSGIMDPARNWTMYWNLAATLDANSTVRYGLCSGGTHLNNPPSDGIWIECVAGEANWFGVCRVGGVQTRVQLGGAVSAAYAHHRIRRVDATTIGFQNMNALAFTNWSEFATINTNVPTAALTPFAQIRNSAATNKALDLDYFKLNPIGLDR